MNRFIWRSRRRVGWCEFSARLLGSFAQRYVKRHAPVRERAETRRLRWFLSPDFKAVFGGDRRRNPEPFVGHVALQGQVDVFPKPWNWERRDMGRLSGGKPRKTCSSTVFGNRCSGLTPREGFRNECARQRCDGLKDAVCATRVVFKGTGTIWLRCHRSRRQDRGRCRCSP